ncbi:MAG: hypothetical protein L6R38_001255 [Xanthoria sp. 2 TBL-2021]|nr:MAG: hypothetical protein L6R38_001255 [Xanthoria sp. 2 TBL-2021]
MSDDTLISASTPAPPKDSLEDSRNAWEKHPDNPYNWPEPKKWRIALLVAAVILLVGLNATSVTTPSLIIAEHFHVADTAFPHSYWPVTVWNTGAAIGPMVGMPLLENFGIRRGYMILYLVFTAMVIPQALAQNLATLLVVRAIAGLVGGVLQNLLEQVAPDIWATDKQRNLPITLYTFVYISGVTLGPVLGAIVHELSWRWVFYIQLIIYGAMIPVVFTIMKETRGPIILSRLAKTDPTLAKAANEFPRPKISALLYDAIARPAHLLLTEPVVFFLMLWAAFCFGLVFIMTQSIPQVYHSNYGFSDSASGLVQVSLFVGEAVGFLACLPQNSYYQRSAKRNTVNPGTPIPEARLPLSIPASLLGLAGGLFWYAWASFPHVHWMVPTVGLAFVGFAVMVIITAVDMYITDAYTKFAGSAIAAVALGENLVAAWLPFAAKSMYTTLGFQWASSLLAFVAVVLTMAPVVLWWKGEVIRGKSGFIKEAKEG